MVFTDYELFGLQLSDAISDRTHVSAAVLFPVSLELLNTFTLGVKHNYLQVTNLQAAIWASIMVGHHFGSIGNVFSVGSPSSSLHLGIGWGSDFKKKDDVCVMMFGAMKDLTPRVKLMGEFITTNKNADDKLMSTFNVGLRFKGHDLSWDIGGFRPFISNDNGSNLIALPFVKATYVF